VYALAWGSDGDRVAFSSGKDVIIKPLQVRRPVARVAAR
jgi:hypothetical protein